MLGVGAVSDLAAPLEGYSSGRESRGQRGLGQRSDACLTLPVTAASGPVGGPAVGGAAQVEPVPGEGRLGPGLGWNLHFERASGVVRDAAGPLTSWQEGQASGGVRRLLGGGGALWVGAWRSLQWRDTEA